MAGTDHRQNRLPRGADGIAESGPAIVLVEPQLGENIGTTARAMLNCGLGDLRLVSPRDGWPNDDALAAASGAVAVLDRARVFDAVEPAVADLQHVYATTARPRDMVKTVVTPGAAARAMRAAESRGERSGVLFGRERIGLLNDEVALVDTLLSVPLNPGFSSLNLAQAVLLVGYEYFRRDDPTPPRQLSKARGRRPATQAEVVGFFEHLEGALDRRGFFRTPELRPTMVRNLRNLFHRAALTDQEVRTLHGVVTALCGRRKDQLDD